MKLAGIKIAKMNKVLLFCVSFFLLLQASKAQLTGVKTIPGDYASITAAVTALNAGGVGAGGVTFNIAAGYTETGNNTITATGTAANPIIFQKSGAGVNPTITAGVGAGWDAIIKLVGSDYITFDGLTLQENPANGAGNYIQKTENGFAFFKVDYTNGCQHNTIKNCNISLDRLFFQISPGNIAYYSTAVNMNNVNAGNNWINQESTSSGTHSYNLIQNNTIFDVGEGIFLYGYHFSPSSLAVVEKGNEIKDNSITYGGNSIAEGIRLQYTANNTISGNVISTNTAHQAGAHAITYNPHGRSGCLITNNTIQLNGTSVLNAQGGIQVTGGGSPGAADAGWKTITITNNTILPSSSNYDYFGIYCLNGGAEFETIENNTINLNSNSAANSGDASGIGVQNWWADATIVSIKNNLIQGHASSLTNFSGIYTSDNTDLITIENNKIINNNSSIYQGINITGSNGSVAKNNIIVSGTANTHYTYIGLQISTDGTHAINNYIGNRASYSASAVAFGIQVGANGNTNPIKVYHNTVYIDGSPSSVNVTSAFSINTAQTIDVRNNIFYNAMLPGTFGNNKISAFALGISTPASPFMARNNLFYAGTPSTTNFIYKSTNGEFQTLENYKMHVCSKDINSVSETVPFLSLDYTNPSYLHINPAAPSLVNNMGFATPEVTVDYDGNVRSATTPDIGADELNGIVGVLTTPLTPPVLWLKADAGVFTDAGVTAAANGQDIQQWNDQSCSGFNVTQTNAANKPTWHQYAFNGKPAVYFHGSNGNHYLSNLTQNLVSPGAARTVFIVAKTTCQTNEGGNLFTFKRTAPVASLQWYNYANNIVRIYNDDYWNGGINMATVNVSQFTIAQNNPALFTYCVPTANAKIDLYLNGNQQTVTQAGNVVNETGTDGFTVGDREDFVAQPWKGWIAEVIVYDRALTTTERQSVEAYLQTKYQSNGLPANFTSVPAATVSSNSNQADAVWNHTYNNTDNSKIIVSVKDNCLNLGTINSTVYADATAGSYAGNRYMRRHYVINPTTDPVGTKRVRLYYTNADFADLQTYIPTLTSASQLVITKFDGTNEDGVYNPAEGTSVLIPSSQITTGTVFGVNYLEFDVAGFSEFWIHTGSFVLPLSFISFSAQKCNSNNVCLTWKTANEQNVSHFEVERSNEGIHYSIVGTVQAGGNNYTYEDRQVSWNSKGLYYRIKQVDNDNRSKRSNVVWLKAGTETLQVYPTLVSSSFTVQNNSAQARRLQLTDATGKMVLMQRLETGTNVVSMERLANGVYFYAVKEAGGELITGKIIKQ
jgi:hypothetical protein